MKRLAIFSGVLGVGVIATLYALQKGPLRCYRYFYYPNDHGLYYDPKSEDPQYAKAFASVREAAKVVCGPPSLGYGPCMQAEERRRLEGEHGISWRTPAELNPCVIFD